MSTATAKATLSGASRSREMPLDRAGVVHLIENHDRAYGLWREAGLRDRVLIHVDAHHDMWWTEDHRAVSIANFICPALKEHIVREMFWVVPDGTWTSMAGRAAVGRHVKRILESYPGDAVAQWGEQTVRTTVLGRPFAVCSLESLPIPAERVLLDLDTDYLTIPRVSYGEWDAHSALPWRWPSELISLLRAKRIDSDFTTVAYSVEGGHTPLQWKYLGAELAFRLQRVEEAAGAEPYDLMREGALAQHCGDYGRAEGAFRSVGDSLGAAPHFHLAHLLAEQDRIDEGRGCYQRALALDPSYRTVYSCPGVPLHLAKSYAAAGRAFRRTSRLDPDDAYARLGLGWVAARRRLWPEAEAHARASLTRQPDAIDGHRLLAAAVEKQGRVDEAIRAYEQSLKLGLAGRVSFNGVVATNPGAHALLDSDHARTHARLARLYARKGDDRRAITGYRIAISGGHDNPSTRFQLARVLAKQRNWDGTVREGLAALAGTPRAIRRAGVSFRQHLSAWWRDSGRTWFDSQRRV